MVENKNNHSVNPIHHRRINKPVTSVVAGFSIIQLLTNIANIVFAFALEYNHLK
jgi:hypothetical protein